MITIKFPPRREWQEEILTNEKRFKVIVCHRRAGKTVVALMCLLKNALTNGKFYAYISPTYKQSKNIAWDILKKMVQNIPGIKINEGELKIVFENGSRIQLFGSDNPDSLRGLDIYGCIFDEYAQQPSNIYSEIVFPMINANNGFVLWIGTPKGKNEFYKLYLRGTQDDKFFNKVLRASESKLLNEDQLKQAEHEMTKAEYLQEYECSFDASIRGAYYAEEIDKLRKENRIKKSIYDPVLETYTFWDLGISDYMAIIFVQVVGNEIRVVDYEQSNGKGFEYYRNRLTEKGYAYGKHFFPHDIRVKELTTGQSRLEVVQKMFGESKCEIIPNHKVIDGINAGRLIFAKCWFDEDKTQTLLEALSLYRQDYDEGKGIFRDNPIHDWTSHGSDAFRYMAMGYNMITKTEIEIDWEKEYSAY